MREQQPCLVLVALHGAFGEFERLRDLDVAHAAEVAHLDHPDDAWINLRQFFEGRVHVEDLLRRVDERTFPSPTSLERSRQSRR